jgi:hypothetical protein
VRIGAARADAAPARRMAPTCGQQRLGRLDLRAGLVQYARVTRDEALKELADAEVVPCVSAGISDIKEILDACLEAGIPAVLDRQDGCDAGHGCATRIDLCVRPDDLPKVMVMMRERWQGLVEQEGIAIENGAPIAEDDDPPCPACGAPGPLAEGACKECGLQLE